MRKKLFLIQLLTSIFMAGNAIAQYQSDNTVYVVPDQAAVCPKGETFLKFIDWVESQLQLNDKPNNTIVLISFIIEKNGTLSNIKAERPADQALIDDAIRVIRASGRWKPAMMRNQIVRSKLTAVVNFIDPSLKALQKKEKEEALEQSRQAAQEARKRQFEDCGFETLDDKQLTRKIASATKPVVVLTTLDFSNPYSRRLLYDWKSLFGKYGDSFSACFVKLDDKDFIDRYEIKHYPAILFFYNRQGSYMTYTGYDTEKRDQLTQWFDQMMSISEF